MEREMSEVLSGCAVRAAIQQEQMEGHGTQAVKVGAEPTASTTMIEHVRQLVYRGARVDDVEILALCAMAEEYVRLHPDAARYRFLRDDEHTFAVFMPREHGHIAFMAEGLDARVDEAMRATPAVRDDE